MADSDLAILIKVVDQASRQLAAVEKAIGSVGKNAQSANGSINLVEKALGGLGKAAGAAAEVGLKAAGAGLLGLGAGLAASVKSAADFEQRMSSIGAVSGASAKELGQLQGLALQLGKDTSFSASEAASGIEELVKAGLSIEDILGGGAKAALDLAAAGELGLADAAEIASNALNAFGLKGPQLGHVADLIAGAANASAISVEDFKYSLSAAGAVAATAGISFDSLAEAIAVMGNAGVKGSDAGTSLKALIAGLTPSTKPAIAAMKELGLMTASGANKFFDASGKMKSFNQIAQLLQESTAKLTEEQKLMKLETIFGSDAIRAAGILAKNGSAGFNEMATAMGKVTAAEVGAKRLDNLKGALGQLAGSVETAAITLGLALTPAIRKLVDMATTGLNAAMPTIQKFAELVSSTIAGDAGMGDWVKAFQDLAGIDISGLAGMLEPLPGQFAALTAAGAEFFGLLSDNKETITTAAAGLAGFLIALEVAKTVTAITAAFTAFGASVTAAGGVLPAIVALLGGPVTLVVAGVAAAVIGLALAWQNNWFDIQGVTAQVVAAIQRILGGDAVAVLNEFLGWIQQVGGQIPPLLAQWAAAFLQWVRDAAPPMLAALANLAADVLTWIIQAGINFAAELAIWGIHFVAWVAKDVLPNLPGALANILNAISQWISGSGPQVAEEASAVGGNMMEGIRNGIMSRLGSIAESGATAVRRIIEAAKEAAGIQSPSIVFADIGRRMLEGLGIGIKDNTFTAVNSMHQLIDKLTDVARRNGVGDAIVGRIREQLEGLDAAVGTALKQAGKVSEMREDFAVNKLFARPEELAFRQRMNALDKEQLQIQAQMVPYLKAVKTAERELAVAREHLSDARDTENKAAIKAAEKQVEQAELMVKQAKTALQPYEDQNDLIDERVQALRREESMWRNNREAIEINQEQALTAEEQLQKLFESRAKTADKAIDQLGEVNDVLDEQKDITEDVNDKINDLIDNLNDLSFDELLGAFNVDLPGRAAGGLVNRMRPYIVGERGPELFVPGVNGSIVSNEGLRNMGGGGSVSITVNVNGSVTSERDLVDTIYRGLVERGRRNGLTGITV